eukprot:7382147-Prymnesium_polylepis.1
MQTSKVESRTKPQVFLHCVDSRRHHDNTYTEGRPAWPRSAHHPILRTPHLAEREHDTAIDTHVDDPSPMLRAHEHSASHKCGMRARAAARILPLPPKHLRPCGVC